MHVAVMMAAVVVGVYMTNSTLIGVVVTLVGVRVHFRDYFTRRWRWCAASWSCAAAEKERRDSMVVTVAAVCGVTVDESNIAYVGALGV
jgi:hypothetical protein